MDTATTNLEATLTGMERALGLALNAIEAAGRGGGAKCLGEARDQLLVASMRLEVAKIRVLRMR